MDTSVLLGQGGTAAVSAIILQAMKKSNWFTFLGTDEKNCKANMMASIVFAFVMAMGVSYTFNDETGDFKLAFNIYNATHLAGHWFLQWCAQHFAYKTMVVPTELQAAAVNILKEISKKLEKP